jgi:hypothetical protein
MSRAKTCGANQPREELIVDKGFQNTPQPFGIDWLDDMTGGGLARGDGMLFLGPTAGGKTALATQISVARAMQRSHVVYCTYDQPLTGDLEVRFLSLILGIPRQEFENRSLLDMPGEVQQRFQDWRVNYGGYLHAFDFNSGDQGTYGVNELRTIVSQETKQGRKPDLIIVDYLGMLSRRFMKAPRVGGNVSDWADIFAEQFFELCRSEQIQGILFEQLSTDYQLSRTCELDHTMAHECKTLGDHCQVALAINAASTENFCLVHCSKSRSDPQGKGRCIVTLNGAMNRIESAKDVTYDERSGLFWSSLDQNHGMLAADLGAV